MKRGTGENSMSPLMVDSSSSKKHKRCDGNEDDDEDADYGCAGTTTAAFVCKPFVMMGSDQEMGNPSGTVKMVRKKTLQLGNLPIGVTKAGTAVHAHFMFKSLENFVKGGATDITSMPGHLMDLVGKSVKLPHDHGGQLLIGGYSKGSLVPHLYFICKDGVLDLMAPDNVLELKMRFQTGSGKGAAFVKLNEGYVYDMTETQGKTLIEDSIYNGILHDKYTGFGIDYILIRPDEVGKVELVRRSLVEFRQHRTDIGNPV